MLYREMPNRRRVILLVALLVLLSLVPLVAAVAQPGEPGYHLTLLTGLGQNNLSTGGDYVLTGLATHMSTLPSDGRTYDLDAFQIEGLLSNPCVYLPITSKGR